MWQSDEIESLSLDEFIESRKLLTRSTDTHLTDRVQIRLELQNNAIHENTLIKSIVITKYDLRSDYHFFIHAIDEKAFDELQKRMGPSHFWEYDNHSRKFSRICLVTQDNKLIAFMFNKIIQIEKCFEKDLPKVSSTIGFSTTDAYEQAPEWIQVGNFNKAIYHAKGIVSEVSHRCTDTDKGIHEISLTRLIYSQFALRITVKSLKEHEMLESLLGKPEHTTPPIIMLYQCHGKDIQLLCDKISTFTQYFQIKPIGDTLIASIKSSMETIDEVQQRVQPSLHKTHAELAAETAEFLKTVYGGPSTLIPQFFRAPAAVGRQHILSVEKVMNNIHGSSGNKMEKK